MSPLPLTLDLPRLPVWHMVPRILTIEISTAARRVCRALGIRRPAELSPAQLAVPDTALAKKATALARAIEPELVFNHSVRTFLFGMAIGRNIGMRPDPELLYIAAILHDVGLMPEHEHERSFELTSASVAHGFLQQQGVDPVRAALVHEAIALHTSAGLAGSREPEIALTHFGAGLDVLGIRREDVAPATLDAITEAWPRERFREEFAKLMLDQSTRKPDCHIAGWVKLGLLKLMERAPFDT